MNESETPRLLPRRIFHCLCASHRRGVTRVIGACCGVRKLSLWGFFVLSAAKSKTCVAAMTEN